MKTHTKIRTGMFETNSSSSHSITIANNPVVIPTGPLPGWYKDDADGAYHLTTGEFGWGVDTFTGSYTKASYCLTDNLNCPDRLAQLRRVLEGAGLAPLVFDDLDGESGYVDHQSSGTSGKAFESDDTLRRFIFDSASVLHICNDNSSCDECEARRGY